jgi:putative DNA primase/helicase
VRGLGADDGFECVRPTNRPAIYAGERAPREPPAQRKQCSRVPADKSKAQQHDGGGPTRPLTTEDALALAFARAHAHALRHVAAWSKWLFWDDQRWACDETLVVFDLVRRQCRAAREALPADAPEKLRAILSRASTVAAVERLAKSDRRLAATVDQWDADPGLLNTPAGLIDLRTGELRPHDPGEYCTRITAVAPDFSAGRQLWTRFIDEATLGDRGLQRFLQQVAGYCLTGDVREHALFFLYGSGGNGKSVFLNVLAGIMGDYATTAAMDTFTVSVTDKHPTDLAMLRGARMVSASETEEGRAWAESRIKQMTGGDPVRARFMRQDFFEYRPQFKLVIIGNHKPVLRNVDDAARRRFNIIPFVHKPSVPDRRLEEKLKSEWPAILAWAIEGALDWRKNGLVRPDVVANATDAYFCEQDSVRQWIEECCETGPSVCDTTANLFASWTAYAQANGEKPGSTKWFSQVLQRQGYDPVSDTPGHRKKRGFLGITVKALDTSFQWQNRAEEDDAAPF